MRCGATERLLGPDAKCVNRSRCNQRRKRDERPFALHVTDGSPCWCNPTFERQDNGHYVVIHKEEEKAAN